MGYEASGRPLNPALETTTLVFGRFINGSDVFIHRSLSDVFIHGSDVFIQGYEMFIYEADMLIHGPNLFIYGSDIHRSEMIIHGSDVFIHGSDMFIHGLDISFRGRHVHCTFTGPSWFFAGLSCPSTVQTCKFTDLMYLCTGSTC